MGAIRNPEAGLMEALRTLRAVPGVIAPLRLSLILLACGGTRYITVERSYGGELEPNTRDFLSAAGGRTVTLAFERGPVRVVCALWRRRGCKIDPGAAPDVPGTCQGVRGRRGG